MESIFNFINVSEKRKAFLLLILFAIFALMMFSDGIASGQRSFFAFPDNRTQFYPWYQKIANAIQEGHLPLWAPNSLSGFSLAGEIQPGLFYPPLLLAEALFGRSPDVLVRALEYLIIAHFAVAATSIFFLAREIKLDRIPAFASSIVFAFSGSLAARAQEQTGIFWGLCLMPLVLFFVLRYFTRNSIFYAVFAGMAIAFQVLAGHIQPAFHTVLLVAGAIIYFTIRNFQKHARLKMRQFTIFIMFAGASCVLFLLPQLIISAQYFPLAYRWVGMDNPVTFGQSVSFDVFGFKNIIELNDLKSMIDPWKHSVADGNTLFIGLLPLSIISIIPATLVLSRDRARGLSKTSLLLMMGAFCAFIVMIGHITPIARILHAMPLLTQVRQLGRYAIIWHLCMALLVGCGIQIITQLKLTEKLPLKLAAGLVAIALSILFALIWKGYFSLISKQSAALLLPVIAVLVFAAVIKNRKIFSLVCLAGVAFSALMSRDLFIPPSPDQNNSPAKLFASTPLTKFLEQSYGKYRVLLHDSAGLPQNYGLPHNIETKLGYGATMYKPYYDFLSQDWSLNGKVNDLLNIRYVVSRDALPLPLVFEDPNSKLKVYERQNWYPRAFFKSQLAMSGRAIEATNKIDMLEFGDLQQSFHIKAQNDKPDDLIFSEINYPGWRAFLDDQPVQINTADIPGYKPLFRSVTIPPGEHTITFVFQPLGMLLTLAIWILAIIIGCGVFLLKARGTSKTNFFK